jgi:hypothetical protein
MKPVGEWRFRPCFSTLEFRKNGNFADGARSFSGAVQIHFILIAGRLRRPALPVDASNQRPVRLPPLLTGPFKPLWTGTLMPEGYCVKCKAKKEITDAVEETMKNGRKAIKGKCPTCGTVMFKILGGKASSPAEPGGSGGSAPAPSTPAS